MTQQAPDQRLNFADAIQFVRQSGSAAFAALPVFGDDEETAEGARLFILEGDSVSGYRLRFIAGPFFSAAYAANEMVAPEDIPDRVRELGFLPTRYEEDWLSDQLQVLIHKLMQAAGVATTAMPDYGHMPAKGAGPAVEFPVSFIGRGAGRTH